MINRVNSSVTNRNRKDVDIQKQIKSTSPVVVLKYYDYPVATATLLFYIWFVSMTRHHLLVTSAFVCLLASVTQLLALSMDDFILEQNSTSAFSIYSELTLHTDCTSYSKLFRSDTYNLWSEVSLSIFDVTASSSVLAFNSGLFMYLLYLRRSSISVFPSRTLSVSSLVFSLETCKGVTSLYRRDLTVLASNPWVLSLYFGFIRSNIFPLSSDDVYLSLILILSISYILSIISLVWSSASHNTFC